MKSARLALMAAFVLLLIPVHPIPASAQSPTGIQVLGAVSTPGQDSLGLDVYFVAIDGAGKPMKHPSINAASIQVIGGSQAPASVGDPNSDIYIVMLMDTSGSMTNVVGNVQEAALSSLESMPANARVSVVSFNEKPTILTDFTNDRQGVADSIQSVRAVNQAGTCLYDAVWNAVDRLEQTVQRPQDRRAVILFTDGRDQRSASDTARCSVHTYNDMIAKATDNGITPLNTIGLCESTCGNLNADEIQGMAHDSGGFSAMGGTTDLSTMFREIMDGLNSQLAAHAEVYARQGENQGVLTLRSNDGVETSSAPFVFISDRDYTAPPAAPEIHVPGLSYDSEANSYQLALSVSNPEPVAKLILTLEETDGGKTVITKEINLQGQPTLQTVFSGEDLTPKTSYTAKISAVDQQGFLFERTNRGGFNNDDETVLASKEFIHDPKAPLVPPCNILSVNSDAVNLDTEKRQFTVDLEMPEEWLNELHYQGSVKDSDTGANVQNFGIDILKDVPLVIPMDDAIADAKTAKEYQLSLDFKTFGDSPQRVSCMYDFKVTPTEPPPLWERILTFIQEHPLVLPIVAGFLTLFIGFRYLQNRQNAARQNQERRPPMNLTASLDAVRPTPGNTPGFRRVQLRVVRSPDNQARNEIAVTSFPFVIGRTEGNLKLSDPRISRKHTTIGLSNGQIFVQDMNSKNHTYVNGRQVPPNERAIVSGVTTIRLGPDTELEIQPY
ncbi:MAG: VWA domain-containing protein [Anaerolineae bacterium]|nr:VWA domain-containing protein [Anaerolineae bacterium]